MIQTYAIVIRGNETSENYWERVEPSWLKQNIHPTRFDAITPDTLPCGPLVFHAAGCQMDGIMNKEFTPTELACWYSHYTLWKRISESNERSLVLEHDALLLEEFVDNPTLDFYKLGAHMEAYVMSPELATYLCKRLEEGTIIVTLGPQGFLHDFTIPRRNTHHRPWVIEYGIKTIVRQLFDESLGITINHWNGTPYEMNEKLQNYQENHLKVFN